MYPYANTCVLFSYTYTHGRQSWGLGPTTPRFWEGALHKAENQKAENQKAESQKTAMAVNSFAPQPFRL